MTRSNLRTALALLAFIAAGKLAHATETQRPAGANCTERATVTATGAIAIHWVCVAPAAKN